MNETYDKLIDIIAVDIKLAIELIKGQDIDVGEFVDYLTINNIFKIENIYILECNSIYPMCNNIPESINKYEYTHWTKYDTFISFKNKLIKFLNHLKNEQN